eukprot:NODE_1276_length_1400_cov_60.940299_g1265_i0.p1 GENE.NODE_1276_length_1400_cov_60.940299_g1265_i0~~NODE_1276_length_1400_cov_60.940299_g1265_i0.p1  ORF type:complete len:425 (-),score=86.76 NODE_1276_length_1400_cov_60.940299_g1265_i0:34-1308(-)
MSAAAGEEHNAARKKEQRKLANLQVQVLELEDEGQLAEAVELHWQILELCKLLYGTSSETDTVQLKIAELNTQLAMDHLQQNRFLEASKFLTAADNFTSAALPNADLNSRRLICRASMFKAQTCIKKNQGNIRGALKYTEKGLAIMLKMNMLDDLPSCYLNLCALYSALGLHAEALKHAFLSLQVVKELIKMAAAEMHAAEPLDEHTAQMLGNVMPTPDLASSVTNEVSPELNFKSVEKRAVDMPPAPSIEASSRLTQLGEKLAITYFNIAVEQEFLGDAPAFYNTYRIALVTAEEFLGGAHPLTTKFRRAMNKANRMAQQAEAAAAEAEIAPRARRGHGTATVGVSSVYAAQVRGQRGGKRGRAGGRKAVTPSPLPVAYSTPPIPRAASAQGMTSEPVFADDHRTNGVSIPTVIDTTMFPALT